MYMACGTTKSVKDSRGQFGLIPILHAKPRLSFFEDVTMKKIDISTKSHLNTFALVDDEDYEELSKYKWSFRPAKYTAYAVRSVKRNGKHTMFRMHREILGLKAGDGKITDHIDCNGLNNQKSNLRTCTNAQNSMNHRGISGTSQYKGVCWDTRKNKWMSVIMKDDKLRFIGYFEDEIEAAKSYDTKAKELFEEFAWLNFPNGKARYEYN